MVVKGVHTGLVEGIEITVCIHLKFIDLEGPDHDTDLYQEIEEEEEAMMIGEEGEVTRDMIGAEEVTQEMIGEEDIEVHPEIIDEDLRPVDIEIKKEKEVMIEYIIIIVVLMIEDAIVN